MDEWEAKYKALLAGITDEEYVKNAEMLVEAAVKISTASMYPLESVVYSMLQVTSVLQRSDFTKFEKRISIFFAWYDFWIGFFYDRKKRILYFCPFPMVVIKLRLDKSDKVN